MNTNVYLLGFGLLLAANVHGAPCTAPRAPQTFYVSMTGSDANNGAAPATAFRNIQTGVNCLMMGGDRLLILPGTYTEFVTVRSKNGTPSQPIVIEGLTGIAPGPLVTIQGSITGLPNSGHTFQFHSGSPAAPNNEWVSVGSNGEYESLYPLPPQTTDWSVDQGGFVDPVNGRHTRLITYHRVEDLRSGNETFEKIVDGCPTQDPRPGPILSTTSQGCTERRPWVYMGPGLWFDRATNKVHIRLSPTHNAVPGLADYVGETDPNKLALSIADKNMTSLKVDKSTNIQFKNLAVKFSSVSVIITGSSAIGFDNVTIWAGRYAVRAGGSNQLRFSNSVFDGGLPTWMFRNDLKDQYKFLQGGQLVDNFLGKQTMEALMAMEIVDTVEIDHCEFTNAHDLYLQASNVNFHHNWINNLNDEALFLDGSATASGLVHHNVIEQTLSAISFAGDYFASPWRVYRNLVDLRSSTAGIRPRNTSFNRSYVWRPGAAFKYGNKPEGPYDIFQNTFIVPFAAEFPDGQPTYPQASFTHLRNSLSPHGDRSSLNNIFAVLNREANWEAPLAFLLPPGAPAEINGDYFYRKGYGTRVFATPIPGDLSHFHIFSCMPSDNCLDLWHANPFFQSTEIANTTGYEAQSGLLVDPQFNSWSGEPNAADDFRLKPDSPALMAGVPLPIHLQSLDSDTPAKANPDVGAYQTSGGLAPKLKVGVGGRKVYPQAGPGN